MKCICAAVSKDFLPGFRAMVNSITIHTKDFAETLLCLDIDLKEEHRSQCRKIYPQCQFIKPDKSQYQRLPKHTRPLRNAFFKLECFKIAQGYEQMLFIDSDIIFLDSIQELLDTKPTSNVGLSFHTACREYNTGLILFDKLPTIIYDKVIELLQTMKNAHLADQTVIMTAIKKNIFSVSRLPRKWNTTKRQAKKRKGKPRNYVGLHFVGKKPWKGGEKGYEDFEELWRKYA